MKVAALRLSPTRLSFGERGKKMVSTNGIRSRRVARPKRIFATSSSPATRAWASTGSGRDQSDLAEIFSSMVIVSLELTPGDAGERIWEIHDFVDENGCEVSEVLRVAGWKYRRQD